MSDILLDQVEELIRTRTELNQRKNTSFPRPAVRSGSLRWDFPVIQGWTFFVEKVAAGHDYHVYVPRSEYSQRVAGWIGKRELTWDDLLQISNKGIEVWDILEEVRLG